MTDQRLVYVVRNGKVETEYSTFEAARLSQKAHFDMTGEILGITWKRIKS